MEVFIWIGDFISDDVLIAGAAVVSLLNLFLSLRPCDAITTRWDRFLMFIAYGQLAMFYAVVHFSDGKLDLLITRGISRYVWAWFILVGLYIAWQLWKGKRMLEC